LVVAVVLVEVSYLYSGLVRYGNMEGTQLSKGSATRIYLAGIDGNPEVAFA